MKTVNVVQSEKLTQDTATRSETDARDTSEANENENHSHLD
jgi:hypothetical protein